MTDFKIGTDKESQRPVAIPNAALNTHLHLVGATGVGKSTFIIRLLTRILLSLNKRTVFVVDPLGGLANAIVDFVSHPRFCPQHVRDRFIYIEPANMDYVMPLNSLHYENEDDLYFKTGRTCDCML